MQWELQHRRRSLRERKNLSDDNTESPAMDKVFLTLADLGDVRVGGGDSFVDRLNCRYTVFILVICAIIVTTKHYVGDPIACWCPSHFTDSHVDYTNKVCWVTNTYYLPFDKEIPREGEKREIIAYYQWVGLLMICQAVLFYLPRTIWRLLNKKSGIAVTTITDASIECQRKADSESRDKVMRYMTKHLGRFLREMSRKQLLANKLKSIWLAFYGNYLFIMYIFMKLVYLSNAIGQLFLLNAFLGTSHKYYLYGFQVIERLVKGEPLSTSDRFPRVTFCDFKVKILGNVLPYTIQCTLPINLFNEKIYIFIWFWLVTVAAATAGSLLIWIYRCFSPSKQISFIKTRLIAMERLGYATDRLVHSFVDGYLKRDGMLIIWLVASNSSDLVAAELIGGLFDYYKENKKSVERLVSKEEGNRLTGGALERGAGTLVQRAGSQVSGTSAASAPVPEKGSEID